MTADDAKPSASEDKRQQARGRTIALSCVAFVFGMVGMAYASVPLYEMFCNATGYGGTTQRAEAGPTTVSEQSINVRFDSNVEKGLPWSFQPTERQLRVKLGEVRQTAYRVKNLSDKPITARADYNVTPESAGAFFNKIACFCFNDQTLQPGEEQLMPVIFFVSPDALDAEDMRGLPTITLSYTFFGVDKPASPVAAGARNGTQASF
ncbi:cytochrome c oxidase assembly protein [Aureimonas psammosilenae]|uniref:cytochrome c oxidase assembly protein n=1 Tax=Aureimonas psammosilenae TaxID=2495496 RepID=UPI001260B88C|nr:cytochrome c oxidase assembly protein [Aureimonas psammosilenae]